MCHTAFPTELIDLLLHLGKEGFEQTRPFCSEEPVVTLFAKMTRTCSHLHLHVYRKYSCICTPTKPVSMLLRKLYCESDKQPSITAVIFWFSKQPDMLIPLH